MIDGLSRYNKKKKKKETFKQVIFFKSTRQIYHSSKAICIVGIGNFVSVISSIMA